MKTIKISHCSVIEGAYMTEDRISYRSYGIEWEEVDSGQAKKQLVEDISLNKCFVQHITYLLNHGQISSSHLLDIIQDSIS